MYTQRNLVSRWLMQCACLLIKLYQVSISPFLSPMCRYFPSCSHYAIQAIQEHGVIKGGYLTARRLCRCHPFSRCEIHDPVPLKKR